jgi:hypothetical protein
VSAANGYSKPLPNLSDAVSAPYWQAAQQHRLSLPRCESCGHVFFYPRLCCPRCWSEDVTWIDASGRGTVFSFTWVHVAFYDDTWKDDVPYCVGWIELEEGPRLVSAVVDATPGQVEIGAAVTVCFDDVTPEVTLPKFRLS